MGKSVRSAKGQLVDFDALKIKEQLASAPTPMEVRNRQNFIENRLKRRLKKKLPVVESSSVDVKPKLPEPAEDIDVPQSVVEETTEQTTEVTTKQKARKKI